MLITIIFMPSEHEECSQANLYVVYHERKRQFTERIKRCSDTLQLCTKTWPPPDLWVNLYTKYVLKYCLFQWPRLCYVQLAVAQKRTFWNLKWFEICSYTQHADFLCVFFIVQHSDRRSRLKIQWNFRIEIRCTHFPE